MMRLAASLGTLIALAAIAPAAQAGSYAFSIGGHRFHVEAPRHCRSTSCVSISADRGFQPIEEDVDTTPAPPPAPVVAPPQPTIVVTPPAPPPPPAPVVAATSSRPVLSPPRFDPPNMVPPRLEPPHVSPPAVAPEPVAISARSDGESADAPLGQWESAGARGMVRIERCGPALCGYALTESSGKGESVLVNMKPTSDGVWTGNIYSRSSGNTYYGTMTLKPSGRLHVEACALGRFFCTGNDWMRVEEGREKLITTSRQWGARS